MKKLLLLLALISTNCYAKDHINCDTILESLTTAVQRCPTPEGWLIVIWGGGLTYVPDKNHEWKITK